MMPLFLMASGIANIPVPIFPKNRMASYNRQLSEDIKMKNYRIKTSFVSPEGPKTRANKTGINFMIFILIFVVNCL